jgi:hypothetical protein
MHPDAKVFLHTLAAMTMPVCRPSSTAGHAGIASFYRSEPRRFA